ncbi:MAG: hypothetical protein KDI19_08415 [Pseudomonadales bacterium]|nr:hypothetical protein [Pseudomonadales bacterium]
MDEKEAFRDEFEMHATDAGIAPGYVDEYYGLLFEIATGLVSRGEGLFVLGIAGAQGTGKSTFARLLAIIFERVFERTSLVLSLDDFYLTHAERQQLAARVHPMLAVRGVPGTHDMEMLRSVIRKLKARDNCEVPTFDKAQDDRGAMIPVMGARLDLLVIEGWCWGAMPGSEAELSRPVNELEITEDADGTWRRYVNQQLASTLYQSTFSESEVNFFLAAPGMDAVRRWRWQQEQRLARSSTGRAVMSEEAVNRFVMYYERITARMLKDLPSVSNLTLYLDDDHHFVRAPDRDRR